MRTVENVLWVVVVCAALAAAQGCGKGRPGPARQTSGSEPAGGSSSSGAGGDVAVQNGSPKDVLLAMHEASKTSDMRTVVALIHPKFKEPMSVMMRATEEMIEAFNALAATAEAKFGKDQAAAVRKANPVGKMPSPLRRAVNADGSIDWGKVKITEAGEMATFEVNGRKDDTALHRVGGKWYVGPPAGDDATPEAMLKDAEQAKARSEKLTQALRGFARQVDADEVTKDDFAGKLGEAMMKART